MLVNEVWVWVVSVCTGIIAVSKVIDMIKHYMGRDKIKDLESRIEALEHKYEGQGVMYRAILSMIEHMRTSNGYDGLEKAEDELKRYLTER